MGGSKEGEVGEEIGRKREIARKRAERNRECSWGPSKIQSPRGIMIQQAKHHALEKTTSSAEASLGPIT